MIVDIRQARAGVERELLKYASKAASLPDAKVVEYATTMHGARDITTGAAWHGLASDEDLESDELMPLEAGNVVRLPLPVIEERAADGDEWAAAVLVAVLRQGTAREPGRPPPEGSDSG